MTSPEIDREAPSLVGTGAQTLVTYADKLGLTWRLRPGTVQSAQSISRVTVACDGDSQEITTTSLVGLVSQYSRVMVLQIPPGGNFIIGTPLGYVSRELINRFWRPATADVSLTTTAQLMPGTEVRVNVPGTFEYEATAFFDLDGTVAGTTRLIGELFINGAVVTSVANLDIVGVERANVGQQWVGTANGGSVFDIRARRTVNSGTQFARGTHTTLLLKVFQ